MASEKEILERGLANLRGQINTGEIERLASQLQTNINLGMASQLSQQLGEEIPGFKTLASSVDDIVPQVAGSFPQQTIGQLGIVQLTDNLGELSGQMKSNGSLDVVISAPFAEAVAAATQQLTNSSDVFTPASATQLESIAGQVVDVSLPLRRDVDGMSSSVEGTVDDFEAFVEPALSQSLKGVIGNVIGASDNTLNTIVSGLTSEMSAGVNKANASVAFGFTSLMQNLSEHLFSTTRSQLNTVTRKDGILQPITDTDLKEIISALESDRIDTAVSIVTRYSDLDRGDVYNAVVALDTTLASVLQPDLPAGISSPPVDKVDPSDATFQIIHNKNALISEFEALKRETTVVVITHTASYLDQNLTAEQINTATYETGGIPYHYIIRRDGVIERGRAPELPATTLSDHPLYNEKSIIVAMVGGINSPKPARNQSPDLSGARKSYTRPQWRSLRTLIRSAYTAYPGIQVVGRSQFGDGRTHPGFDVEEYIETLGKRNIIDPLRHDAPTRIQIRSNQLTERGSNAPTPTKSPMIGFGE